ncbi:hypothetical protein [Hornefia porci]|uniref:hypothetical protein n=1 Tax=Hornefia porci TaxID=2652292 RepID=UPI001301629F|nr:hypothetical protein [Hornefia porci]
MPAVIMRPVHRYGTVVIKANPCEPGAAGVLIPGRLTPERKTQKANEESDLMSRD